MLETRTLALSSLHRMPLLYIFGFTHASLSHTLTERIVEASLPNAIDYLISEFTHATHVSYNILLTLNYSYYFLASGIISHHDIIDYWLMR